jgi:hypothetical protein
MRPNKNTHITSSSREKKMQRQNIFPEYQTVSSTQYYSPDLCVAPKSAGAPDRMNVDACLVMPRHCLAPDALTPPYIVDEAAMIAPNQGLPKEGPTRTACLLAKTLSPFGVNFE